MRLCVPTSVRQVEAAQFTTRDLPGRDRPRAPASHRPSVGPALGLRLNAEIAMRFVSSSGLVFSPGQFLVGLFCQAVNCEEQKIEISKQEDSNRTGCQEF